MGNDGYGKALVADCGHGETDAVDGDRPFRGDVALQLGGRLDGQRPALLARLEGGQAADPVDVSQDQVATQAGVGAQGALQVDRVAGPQSSQGGAAQGFLDRLHGETGGIEVDDGLAGAVDVDAVADAQILEQARRGDLQTLESALAPHLAHAADFFD